MSFPQLNNINPHFNDSFYKIGYEDITDYNILNNKLLHGQNIFQEPMTL